VAVIRDHDVRDLGLLTARNTARLFGLAFDAV
jgi:hypothetical protein